jgi:transposase-like protein
MSKIAPSARVREEIAAFATQAEGSESGAHALSRLVQLATARLVQEALEQEQTDFIGRERYVREAGRGKRNGYVRGRRQRRGVNCSQVVHRA